MAKKSAVTPSRVIEASPEPPEVLAVRSDATAIQSFVGGISAFLARTQTMEQEAEKDELATRVWVRPTTLKEDEALVSLVKRNALAMREDEANFKPVTSVLFRFHRFFTTKEARIRTIRERIKETGNRLHNAYMDAETRRAREEEDRLRREAEVRAKAERDAELQQLEEAALKAEAGSPDLSEREREFVSLYTGVNGRNTLYFERGVACATAAGYKNPDQAALKLLKTGKLLTAVQNAKDAIALRQQAEARRQAPVEVEEPEVRAEIATKGTTTWSYEVFDEAAFLKAVLDPRRRLELGIPEDAVIPNPKALLASARALQEKMNLWPGVRAKKNTSIR